ncbi:CU044_2847 family protein [Promicromonospora sp. MEB111]|uniref:CU044_2847 family protein n=1 Tax=Promicromonospora sp. MEB111 TaxID=3040301 RepID=UPI002549F910|nr:CU044_2847 family protein [Promicromonospora sp. MEB111]
MVRLEKLALGNGTEVLVEVEERAPGPGTRPVSRGPGRGVKATLDEALDDLRGVVEAVDTKMRSLAVSPDEITLALGVSMTTEAGVVIARASTEANLSLTLRWSGNREGQR